MSKSLDEKLRAIHADPSRAREFILADAKDADMAFGINATGLCAEDRSPEPCYRTLAEYREQIRSVIRQGVVDIVLMSVSTSEILTLQERLFDDSSITPGVRANDATDVHLPRGGNVHQEAARPFRSAHLDHAQCGHLDCSDDERERGADLGLYSVTFNNDNQRDLETLTAFKAFREEAERKRFRYFLEVFAPNLPEAIAAETMPAFVNDLIVRTLAGVPTAGRPIFLKIPYHGPQAMEELVRYDPHLIVGVLGGSAGTTRDAFQLLYEAKKYGARAALFGRKINNAECQPAFIEFLRHIADDVIEPVEAVRAYHAVLEKLGIRARRSLEDDLQLHTNVMSYGTSSNTTAVPAEVKPNQADDAPPDFARLTSQQRAAYHRQRISRMFGQKE